MVQWGGSCLHMGFSPGSGRETSNNRHRCRGVSKGGSGGRRNSRGSGSGRSRSREGAWVVGRARGRGKRSCRFKLVFNLQHILDLYVVVKLV